MPFNRPFALACSLVALMAGASLAVQAAPKTSAVTAPHTASRDSENLARFEHKAALLRDLGATHMVITEGLPIARWKQGPSDPYPAWFVHHADVLTIFPPDMLRPYVDMDSASQIRQAVQQRCRILRQYGLKGVWNANEPAVLPEAFFTAHPELRGPRIDQPSRSRDVYFAPNVDHPVMLAIYRDGMQRLLEACPEVETFNWTTTDAGSGFDWTPSLYPGENGNSNYRNKPVSDRVAGFMINVQNAAREAGHDIRININPIPPRQWMIPTFSPDVLESIVRKLPRGLAVEGREGPDGRRFQTGAVRGIGGNAFYPVIGLSVPVMSGLGENRTAAGEAERRMYNLGDEASVDLNYRLFKATQTLPMRTSGERLAALRAFAVQEVGEAQADNLIDAWSAMDDARQYLGVLDFGGMLRFGHVLNRWVNRPMVPFPEDLSEAEKQDYRAYLFQAKGEEQANNLADIQAMRMYEGWGAKLLFQRTIELTVPRVERAHTLYSTIAAAQTDPTAKACWEATARRAQALIYLLQSADNMVSYQAQLDRVKGVNAMPETDPVLGVQSSWDRTELMATARKEIDTMVNLKALLDSSPEPLLDLAATATDESIMRLGPDLSPQLKHKIDTMNAHWRDYDRLFTIPNP